MHLGDAKANATRILVQIVVNRETRLSTLFLGLGDNFFGKVMTKTDVSYNIAGDLQPTGDLSPTIDVSKNYRGDV